MSGTTTVVLVTLGSIGDLLPFITIGKALRRRNHPVVIATHEEYRGVCRVAGLDFRSIWDGRRSQRVFDDILTIDPEALWQRLWRDFFSPAAEPTYACLRELAAMGPIVAVAAWSAIGARLACERTGSRLCTVYLSPEALRLGGTVESHASLFHDSIDHCRRSLGRPSSIGVNGGVPELKLALYPDWFAAVHPSDSGHAILTGFPLHEEALVPVSLPTLRQFIGSGDPPIVFTPGSFMNQGEALFREALCACERLGRRAIFLTPHRKQLPPHLPESVLHLDYVPLHRALDGAAAFFHHGGIGTSAQAMRAGVPQVVSPVFFDQFDNAGRIAALGIGIDLRRHSPDALTIADAINALPARHSRGARYSSVAARFDGQDPTCTICDQVDALIKLSLSR